MRLNTFRIITHTSRPVRQYTVILLLLAALALLTWAFREWSTSRVRASLATHQAEAVTDAFRIIDDNFSELEANLLHRARSLAERPALVQEMRDRANGMVSANDDLVALFASMRLPEQTAIELYDASPSLVAWNGFSMPLDSAIHSPKFLEQPQTAVTSDGVTREALVAWWPVQEGSRVLGAIRVLQVVSFQPPIRNQYLADVSIEDTWERYTQLPIDIDYVPLQVSAQTRRGTSRILQGVDGTVLARVTVHPPSPGQLVDSVRRKADDVLAFWLVLIGFWLFAGLWHWYRCACVVPEKGEHDRSLLRATFRFALVALAWWGLRYLFVALNIPASWQLGKAPLAPLFDPTHLASTIGGGTLRSIGDLFVTSLFAISFSLMFLELAARFRRRIAEPTSSTEEKTRSRAPELVRAFGVAAIHTIVLLGLVMILAVVTRHVILDSTLDYFSRAGFVPPESERMVMVVFSAMLLLTIAAFLLVVGLIWVVVWLTARRVSYLTTRQAAAAAAGIVVPFLFVYLVLDLASLVPPAVSAGFLLIASLTAIVGFVRGREGLVLLSLRGTLTVVALLTLLLYPLFFQGMDARRRAHIIEAADSFEEGRDPRIVYALEQAIEMARVEPGVSQNILKDSAQVVLDSLARESLRGSLLFALGPYDVSLTYLSRDGRPLGRYYVSEQVTGLQELNTVDSLEFDLLRTMYREGRLSGTMVEQVTGRLEQDRFQYAAIAPVQSQTGATIGWVMARAEPQTLLNYTDTPFPRVLLPSGVLGSLETNLSLAEFRNGVLARSLGRDFGRYRLSPEVRRVLNTRRELWIVEESEGTDYLTYYRRRDIPRDPGMASSIMSPAGISIVAIRAPALNTFDHLYYLLRLTIAGLVVGFILYLVSLAIRRRLGTLSFSRIRFRDKVLNAFLGVGIISVVAVGIVGQEVISAEARGTVRNWLSQHLDRVEETLALEATSSEMPYNVLARTHVDSLATRVGLDLNVYRGNQLRQSSRPQLVRDRLLDPRLPIQAYNALYYEGRRFVETTEQIGNFTYKAGYRAILDEQGKVRYVISVPTLPEQERLEEEEARTIAYLFGSLLLLVMAVLATASLMASALTRPIARLRSGLQAAARGRFEQTIPVQSRDEFGELAETFNEMQRQLSESRRQIAQHERQLAWREMARQVAHEIKNPLTPMKLSVQHLRRAFTGSDDVASDKFKGVFERVTSTLIEQIDTLARIADEFHSFARMPSRVLERLDLNRTVTEAVALMQENSRVEITTDLYPEPLIIEADREEIRRVFINLIKNAIEAIPEGASGKIEITTRPDTNAVFSTVRDNGSGVPEEMRDKIFQPNFSTKTSGTGLGLAITRKSIEDIHGEIGFDTEENAGTTFWIRLPLARPEED